MASLTRRDFLKLGSQVLLWASGVLGLGALLRFLSHPTEPPTKTTFDIGPVGDYPRGSRTLRPEVPAMVIHDENGFSALSLTCPHLGCTLEHKPPGFACPCHGSTFAADGTALTGPTNAPLPPLRIEQDANGHLVLSKQ